LKDIATREIQNLQRLAGETTWRDGGDHGRDEWDEK
jgi:hypothetical protein